MKEYPPGYATVLPDTKRHPSAFGCEKLQCEHDIHSFLSICAQFRLELDDVTASDEVNLEWKSFINSNFPTLDMPPPAAPANKKQKLNPGGVALALAKSILKEMGKFEVHKIALITPDETSSTPTAYGTGSPGK